MLAPMGARPLVLQKCCFLGTQRCSNTAAFFLGRGKHYYIACIAHGPISGRFNLNFIGRAASRDGSHHRMQNVPVTDAEWPSQRTECAPTQSVAVSCAQAVWTSSMNSRVNHECRSVEYAIRSFIIPSLVVDLTHI
jgi:hypothetical protein